MKLPMTLLSLALAASAGGASANPPAPVKNVVLVHGAFADGSGWEAVTKLLEKDGFTVAVVQQPETSFEDDVKATQRTLASLDGPIVLVGHSYGGSIITEAGNDPKVVALVYVSAFLPDKGETTLSLINKMPPASKGIKQTPDGYLYLDPAVFAADFCADLPKDKAKFMSQSQVLTAATAFGAAISTPAWRSKPSWGIVSGSDRAINPDLERWMYKRANSQVTEVKGSSHAVYMSHPDVVVQVIERAAKGPHQ
ncbi:alpha/beta hydrolase [Dyella telluris]|uniref:Alpha/beta hydrolase n=1 Tax=Dyella telluris TaxID=2763498 RepID=A0A7G8Q3J9_9GAMM|nr:alpha/beta hydrolase [Dyella telluris]QNK01357.1 alpha/beta hydrolase [Dyella telluris]